MNTLTHYFSGFGKKLKKSRKINGIINTLWQPAVLLSLFILKPTVTEAKQLPDAGEKLSTASTETLDSTPITTEAKPQADQAEAVITVAEVPTETPVQQRTNTENTTETSDTALIIEEVKPIETASDNTVTVDDSLDALGGMQLPFSSLPSVSDPMVKFGMILGGGVTAGGVALKVGDEDNKGGGGIEPDAVAPDLAAIDAINTTENFAINFMAEVVDPDTDAADLNFALQGKIPAGATVDVNTGEFNWTPTSGQTGCYDFEMRVFDANDPTSMDIEAFTVCVNPIAVDDVF